MQEAHTVDSSRHSAASKSRISKFLAGGIAVVGAGAIAVSPVTPVVDDIKVQERAVALTAVADPIVEIQRFFAETRTNLQLLSINTLASSEALAAAFNSANLFGELANIFALNASNPLPLVTRLLNFQAVYGDDLEVALFGWDDNPSTGPTANNPSGIDPYDGVFDRVVEAFEGFGPTLADILTYDPPTTDPNQGPVTNAVFEANFYFVLNILDAFRPLIGATPSGIVPLFSIPGDFLGGEVPGGFDGALPGVERLDNLVNVFNEQTFTRAITGPFQTMAFQIADILDDTQAALDAGNSDAALNELINLPVRVTNAFVNGFVPSFSTCTAPGCSAEWPSLIDATTPAPGLIKYTLVDFQNQLITALGGTPPLPVTTPPTTAGARTGSELLSTTGPAQGATDRKVESAPEVPAADDAAKLASATVPTTTATKRVIEQTEGEAPAASVKKTPTGTLIKKKPTGTLIKKKPTGTLIKKTQEALRKAGDDFNKNVSNLFKPKKKESTKAKPTTQASNDGADTKGGDTKGGDTKGGDK